MRGVARSASSMPRSRARGEIVAGQADRPVVGEAQPLQQHHPAAGADAEARRDMRIRHGLPQLQHAPRRFLVVPPDPFGEPRARLDRVFQHILGDERAAPLLHPHQAAARQLLQRAAHGVAVDGEMLRQFRLGRQPAAGRVACPRRSPAAAGWRSAATVRHLRGAAPDELGGRPSRAPTFMVSSSKLAPVRATSRLTIARRGASCLDI